MLLFEKESDLLIGEIDSQINKYILEVNFSNKALSIDIQLPESIQQVEISPQS